MKKIISICAILFVVCFSAEAANYTVKPKFETKFSVTTKYSNVEQKNFLQTFPITICIVTSVNTVCLGTDMAGNTWYETTVTYLCHTSY